jgi:hypothetical protein
MDDLLEAAVHNLRVWRELYRRRRELFLTPPQLRELVDLGRQLAALVSDLARAPTPQIRLEAIDGIGAVFVLMERFLSAVETPAAPAIRLKSWPAARLHARQTVAAPSPARRLRRPAGRP